MNSLFLTPLPGLPQLVQLATQFAPAFFAILFCLWITRWGHRIYTTAGKDGSPQKVVKVFQLYFIGTAIFGVLLVIVAIVWFFISQKDLYVFKGSIRNLKDYEVITSRDLFIKTQNISPPWNLRDEQFIIVRDKPFTDGQKFQLLFSKKSKIDSAVNKLELVYTDVDEEEAYFEIDFDPKKGINTLKCTNLKPSQKTSSLFSSSFIPSAYATSATIYPKGRLPLSYESSVFQSSPNIENIRKLQDDYMEVGVKINILKEMFVLSKSELWAYLDVPVKSKIKEPLAITLLDLSRHSDKELSYYANNILNKCNLEDYLVKRQNSNSSFEPKLKNILLRMDQTKAQGTVANLKDDSLSFIIKSSTQANAGNWYLTKSNKPLEKNYSSLVVPTGTANGDRYFVRAKWDVQNLVVVNCLTNLFFTSLIHKRSLEQEKQMMSKRDNRIIYNSTKQWAIDIASSIRECGGVAEFIVYH